MCPVLGFQSDPELDRCWFYAMLGAQPREAGDGPANLNRLVVASAASPAESAGCPAGFRLRASSIPTPGPLASDSRRAWTSSIRAQIHVLTNYLGAT